MTEKIIEVKGLKKSFNDIEAIKGIDFFVKKGQLFSFLGPNGAGKSTTIKILCTLLDKNEGEVFIGGFRLGNDDNEIRKDIGVVFQDSVLDDLLTVKENLITRGKFYGLTNDKLNEKVNEVSSICELGEFINRPYGKLSGGQRRRADIARALINTPKILFLDEPTTGLDPKTKDSVWNMILRLKKEINMTIFLTTHYMEEASLSDYITIIDHGEIVVQGTPYDLRDKYSKDKLRIKPKDKESLINILDSNILDYKEDNDVIVIFLNDTLEAIDILGKIKDVIISFEVIHGSMNDVFLNITGGELNND
ncbi:ATP-binding cassette domain-containing protein [uncultured Anaerofustis sp.]|uniref:ABC transporter ATP-binding protein n=1 Tax=uncultured Anaerofustis sp. TaxID=904996 RepID=UPI0025E3B9E7|nr:ATP-binding cassette domain-containing protein [uncultured Anaerofustis sp.]